MRDYLDLIRKRPAFRSLWAAEVVSLFGDWFTVVAVSLITLGAGDRVVLLALSFIAHSLPQALLAPIAGPLADFVDRRRSLLWTAIFECVVTLLMVAAASTEHVVLVPLLVLVRSILGAMRDPALSAALPRVVEPDEIVRANALLSVSWSATFAIGMAAGGLVAGYRPELALAIDAFSFAIAAAIISGLPAIEPEARPEGNGRGLASLRGLLAGMRDAARIGFGDRRLSRAILGKAPVAFAGGAGWIFLNLTTRAHPFLGTAGVTLGVLQGLRGISTGVGPVIAERFLERGVPLEKVSGVASLAAFLGIASFVFASSPSMLLAAALVWGAAAGANWVLTTSEVQKVGPPGFVGRLSAIDGFAWASGMCAAALGTAILTERTGAKTATLVFLGAGVALQVALELATRRRKPPVSGLSCP